MILADPKTREEWLDSRKKGIGGSDAASILGLNKYKTNVELWRQKALDEKPPDISDKSAVWYGKHAEEHIRALYMLDNPLNEYSYHEFRMYANEEYPFIYATLDGEITEINGKKGILEIKTTTIQNQNQWKGWDERIPENYYVQVLHQLLATGWEFVVLAAYIRYYHNDELRASYRTYRINRKDVEEELEYLKNKEIEFWKSVTSKQEPPLILPEI